MERPLGVRWDRTAPKRIGLADGTLSAEGSMLIDLVLRAAGEVHAEDLAPVKSPGSSGGRVRVIERAIKLGARDAAEADAAIDVLIKQGLMTSTSDGREGIALTSVGRRQYLNTAFPGLRERVQRELKQRQSGPRDIVREIATALGVPAFYVREEVRSIVSVDAW